MAERRPLRIVHTSDVHLGAYAGDGDAAWVARRALMEETFGRVIDLANASGADLLVIAGDFFDNDRVPDETVEFAGRQIARFEGQTVLLPGNHDPMDDGRIYWRHDLEAMAPRLRIVRASRWHIALGHGHFVPEGAEVNRSLPILAHEVEAAAGAWDYLALGHWEPHADVSCGGMTAVYSGAPMPLTDANRLAGWAIVVDCDDAGVRWVKHRVDPRPAPDVAAK
ncbi:metallophosphoesterase [bacterium]|nr:metallophosphoesterase [bacterium]